MKQEHHIDKLVEETINSLDGLSRAKANPFLFTRVEARLRQGSKSAWDQAVAFISRPAVALAMLGLVILSNAVAMWQTRSEDLVTDQAQLALSEEYNISVTAFYEEETPEP